MAVLVVADRQGSLAPADHDYLTSGFAVIGQADQAAVVDGCRP
jgi:hypothetical protein